MSYQNIHEYYSFHVPVNAETEHLRKYSVGGEYVMNFHDPSSTFNPATHSYAYRGHLFGEVPSNGFNGDFPAFDFTGNILWKKEALYSSVVHPKTTFLTDKSRGAKIIGTDFLIKKRAAANTASIHLIIANHNAMYGQTIPGSVTNPTGTSGQFVFYYASIQGYGYTDVVNGTLKNPPSKWIGARVGIGYLRDNAPEPSATNDFSIVPERGNGTRGSLESYHETYGVVLSIDDTAKTMTIEVPDVTDLGILNSNPPTMADMQLAVCVAPDSSYIRIIDHGMFSLSSPQAIQPIGVEMSPLFFSPNGSNIYEAVTQSPKSMVGGASRSYITRLPLLSLNFPSESEGRLITLSIERKPTPEARLFDAGVEFLGSSYTA